MSTISVEKAELLVEKSRFKSQTPHSNSGRAGTDPAHAVIPIPQARERNLALSVFKAVRGSSPCGLPARPVARRLTGTQKPENAPSPRLPSPSSLCPGEREEGKE